MPFCLTGQHQVLQNACAYCNGSMKEGEIYRGGLTIGWHGQQLLLLNEVEVEWWQGDAQCWKVHVHVVVVLWRKNKVTVKSEVFESACTVRTRGRNLQPFFLKGFALRFNARLCCSAYVQKRKKTTGRCPVLQYAGAESHVSQSLGKGDAQFFNVK